MGLVKWLVKPSHRSFHTTRTSVFGKKTNIDKKTSQERVRPNKGFVWLVALTNYTSSRDMAGCFD